jgi:hypothetical protein
MSVRAPVASATVVGLVQRLKEWCGQMLSQFQRIMMWIIMPVPFNLVWHGNLFGLVRHPEFLGRNKMDEVSSQHRSKRTGNV